MKVDAVKYATQKHDERDETTDGQWHVAERESVWKQAWKY